MKKTMKNLGITLVLLFSFIGLSVTTYAASAIVWGGTQDIKEAKDKIVAIQDIIASKDTAINELYEQLSDEKSESERLENIIKDKQDEIENLQEDLDDALNQSANAKGLRERLKQAEEDVKLLNDMLSELVKEEG